MATVQIFALLATLSTALALTCYQCDSSENKVCGYGLGSFTFDAVECKAEGTLSSLTNLLPKQCVKLVAKDEKDNEYVARGCMPRTGDGVCTAVAKTLGFFKNIEGGLENIECFTCDGDKCNSANRYTAYSMLGVLFAAVAFLF